MRQRSKVVPRSVMAFPVMLLIACSFILAACPADKFAKAAQLVDNYAIALEAFQTGELEAYKQGFVDQQTHTAILQYEVKLALGGQALSKAIRSAKSAPDTVTAVQAALTASQDLLNSGLTGVKNQQTKDQLTALVVGLRAPLALIATLFA